eukprot:14018806-Alexandrium_andersonii.AAC.1
MLKALQEGRPPPENEDQLWPGGTWECGTCGHRKYSQRVLLPGLGRRPANVPRQPAERGLAHGGLDGQAPEPWPQAA